MRTIWIEEKPLARALARHEAFWRGDLQGGPLMWVTAANAKPGPVIPEPASEEELWTNVDYVIASTEASLARTHFAGDALPVFCPWLGPDQFAAWLGAELELKPRDFTSWAKPFVQDWDEYPEFHIAPDNRWWKLYLEILRESVHAGGDKWVTGYPDLHTGVDALSAIRGRDRLALDLMENPAAVHRAMRQMTALRKSVVDTVSGIVLPAGQGTTNWTMGWSRQHFLCIGQNDFTCMISPQMFEEFCGPDNRECCDHVDWSLYHLDGPGAVRNVPWLLRLAKLHCIQWIQGAGQRLPSQWLPLLREIQAGGKSVQLYYGGTHGGDADLKSELDVLCSVLDPNRLFIWAEAASAEQADAVVAHARKAAYYRYSGDPAAIAHLTYMGDFLLDYCQTPPDHPWPGFLISVPVKGNPYWKCDTNGMIQLDISANMGQGLLRAYQVTGNRRWFEAAKELVAYCASYT